MTEPAEHEHFMRAALEEAKKALENGEVPVGAVGVENGRIVARACNAVESERDSTAHAEIILIKKLSSLYHDWRLSDISVYTTLEPCPMCAGALVNAQVRKIYYGAEETRWDRSLVKKILLSRGGSDKIEIKGGILQKECEALLERFFAKLRKK